MTTAPTERADSATPFPPAFLALVERAQAGDLEVLPQLRELLDSCHDIWLRVGDLAQHARLVLLEDLAAKNLLLQESVARKLDAMQEELREEGDGPLHRLLIERVVLGWLELHALDARCRVLREQFTAPPQVEALERRRLSCQKRYLAAIRSLGMVRKLLRRAPSPVEIASRLRPTGQASRGAACLGREARAAAGVRYAPNATGPAEYYGGRVARVVGTPVCGDRSRKAVVRPDRDPDREGGTPEVAEVLHAPHACRRSLTFGDEVGPVLLPDLLSLLRADAQAVVPAEDGKRGLLMVSCPECLDPVLPADAIGIPQPDDDGDNDSDDDPEEFAE